MGHRRRGSIACIFQAMSYNEMKPMNTSGKSNIMIIGLALSEGFLSNSQLIDQLMAVLASTQAKIAITSPREERDHCMVYDKLRLICSTPRPSTSPLQYTLKLWVDDDSFSQAQLNEYTFNLILQQQQWRRPPKVPPQNCNSIIVSSMEGIRERLESSGQELRKQCKMEVLVRRTQQVSAQQRSLQIMQRLGAEYANFRQQKQLPVFQQFMKWNARAYLRVIGRAWDIWLISHHELQIDKANDKIVEEGFFTRHTENRRLKTCFKAWKGYYRGVLERRR